MSHDPVAPPLAHLRGSRPGAPEWFERALQQWPERRHHPVHGAPIEALSWGRVGDPGLLLLHGNGAHADWYSFIAPLLAQGHRPRRVVAMSFSGMGGSGWRERYSVEVFVDEILQVAQAEGLFEGPDKPVVAGHSFGGFPLATCAAQHGERLRAAVIVDTPIMSRDMRAARREVDDDTPKEGRRTLRPARIYATQEEALMRFRFRPPQRAEALYVVDHIARTSLKPVVDEEGLPGWTWRFDPFLFAHYRMRNHGRDLADARCPLAFVRGARSRLITPEIVAYCLKMAPAGTPLVEVPDADHHVMVDQPLAFVAALQGLLAGWP